MMALPTLAMGLLPVYTSTGIAAPLLLLLTRMLQGVAVGGEVSGPGCLSLNIFRAGVTV